MKICTASPRIEEPEEGQEQFELDNPIKNKLTVEFFKKFGYKSILLGHETYVIDTIAAHIKFNTPIKVAIIADDTVVFVCEYKIHKLGAKSVLTQNFVWSKKGWNSGFVKKCLEYWLMQYDIVATSNVQRPLGVLMWKQFVLDNFDKYFFYYKGHDSITPVKTIDQFYSLEKLIWGKEDIFEYSTLLVSKHSLVPQNA